MPAACAASSRLIPSSALAIASRRRATRVSVVALANLRRFLADRSLRILSAAMMPSLESAGSGNHVQAHRGIASRQHESINSLAGISRGLGQLAQVTFRPVL